MKTYTILLLPLCTLILSIILEGNSVSSQGWSKPPPSYPNQTAPDPRNPGSGGGGGMDNNIEKTTHSPTTSDHSENNQNGGNSNFWDEVNMFYEKDPYLSAFITVSVKAALADGLAQANEFNPKFNPMRNLAFFLYGGLYQGCAQNWIYNVWFPQMFGDGTDFYTVWKKVCFDSFVITTLICLPSAYILKAIVFQYGLKEASIRYYTDITENGLFFYYWSLWIPVQSLTFSVVPEHLRILFIAVVSFFWVIILSTVSNKGDQQRNLKLKEETDAAANDGVCLSNPEQKKRNISYIDGKKQSINNISPRRVGNVQYTRAQGNEILFSDDGVQSLAERQSLRTVV